MDSKTFASLADLAEDLGVSKTKLVFLNKVGVIEADYIVSKKICIFNRKESLSKIKNILRLQAQGKSLKEIKTKLHDKNNLRKNSVS